MGIYAPVRIPVEQIMIYRYMCLLYSFNIFSWLYISINLIEVLQSAAKLITPVEEVFGGSVATTVICRDCLTVSG